MPKVGCQMLFGSLKNKFYFFLKFSWKFICMDNILSSESDCLVRRWVWSSKSLWLSFLDLFIRYQWWMVIWGRHGLSGLQRKKNHNTYCIHDYFIYLFQFSPTITQLLQVQGEERTFNILRRALEWGRIWRGWKHS